MSEAHAAEALLHRIRGAKRRQDTLRIAGDLEPTEGRNDKNN